jgi:hypothetical protein
VIIDINEALITRLMKDDKKPGVDFEVVGEKPSCWPVEWEPTLEQLIETTEKEVVEDAKINAEANVEQTKVSETVPVVAA